VWLDGSEDQIELGQYWIKPKPGFSVKAYNRGDEGYKSIKMYEDPVNALVIKDHTPEIIAKLKAGWKPTYHAWEARRVQYPWRLELKAPIKLTDYQLVYEDHQKDMIDPYRMKEDALPRLRPVPSSFSIYFNDAKGQRYNASVKLYDSYRGIYQPDLAVVWDVFKKMFPERKLSDNDKPVSEAEMARLELEIDEPMDNIYVHLVKGDKRYRVPVHNEKLFELKPYRYFVDDEPATVEEMMALENGPEWVLENAKNKTNRERLSQYTHMVKAGEICPMEGEWIAHNWERKKMHVKTGEVLAGPTTTEMGDVFWYRLRKDGERF
jgi:hypothetical protein